MKSILLSSVFAIALSMCATLAFGWGAEGHRVTGLMADQMLTPKARIQVNQLLDGGALADAVLFADIYREALKREVPGSDKWHYDNIPVCGKLAEKYCEDGHCASAQIPKQFAVLADKSKTKDERAQALKFLIHMVGDIHQPLHAADDYDLGGGRKTIFMPSGTVPRSLHIAWDVDLVKLLIRGMSEADFAKLLIKNHRNDFSRWMRGSPQSWILDSHGIATRLAYGKLPGFTCGEADANGKQVGLYDGKPWGDTAVMLTEDYVKGAVGVLPVLLARAGARIGGLLNSALDPEGATPPAAVVTNKPPVVSTIPKTESLREALSRPAPTENVSNK
ncbi:MAG: S1/P1 nuclease [Gammaproteobacteria bacterium]|nr:S1/P1 nuclease [Gammaproteobacteria bacterium]